eukprot:2127253-Amphidinium_carterae.4
MHTTEALKCCWRLKREPELQPAFITPLKRFLAAYSHCMHSFRLRFHAKQSSNQQGGFETGCNSCLIT